MIEEASINNPDALAASGRRPGRLQYANKSEDDDPGNESSDESVVGHDSEGESEDSGDESVKDGQRKKGRGKKRGRRSGTKSKGTNNRSDTSSESESDDGVRKRGQKAKEKRGRGAGKGDEGGGVGKSNNRSTKGGQGTKKRRREKMRNEVETGSSDEGDSEVHTTKKAKSGASNANGGDGAGELATSTTKPKPKPKPKPIPRVAEERMGIPPVPLSQPAGVFQHMNTAGNAQNVPPAGGLNLDPLHHTPFQNVIGGPGFVDLGLPGGGFQATPLNPPGWIPNNEGTVAYPPNTFLHMLYNDDPDEAWAPGESSTMGGTGMVEGVMGGAGMVEGVMGGTGMVEGVRPWDMNAGVKSGGGSKQNVDALAVASTSFLGQAGGPGFHLPAPEDHGADEGIFQGVKGSGEPESNHGGYIVDDGYVVGGEVGNGESGGDGETECRKRGDRNRQIQVELPDWLVAAEQYLNGVSTDPEWQEMVACWVKFETGIVLRGGGGSGRVGVGLRPKEMARWLSSRNYGAVPKLKSSSGFADEWEKWWADLRKGKNGRAPDGEIGDLSGIKKGGPSGIVVVLIGLAWWNVGDAGLNSRWVVARRDVARCVAHFVARRG